MLKNLLKIAYATIGATLLLCGGVDAAVTRIDKDVPATSRPILDDADAFRFAIVGDRTGGARAGVFEHAVQELNLLRPEFVITIGDQIEGYADSADELARQWSEFESMVNALHMRYFYVPGNHDISNDLARDVWHQRRGPDYYHFVYKGVLFIALNTEDPPTSEKKKALFKDMDLAQKMKFGKLLQASDAEKARIIAEDPELGAMVDKLRKVDEATIGDAQVAAVKKALDENRDARWTIVLMHKPVWRYRSPQFEQIEKLLADRPYTMFAGHLHKYEFTERNHRDYIQLGTTGGVAEQNGELDHVAWITMTQQGPEIANIKLNGVFDRKGP